MISSINFIKQSLGLHLFFARIMKEHSFFLEAGLRRGMQALLNMQMLFAGNLMEF